MKKGKTMRKPRLKEIIIALALTLVFAVPGTAALAANYVEDIGLGNNGKFESRFSSSAEATAEANRIHEAIASEGVILLKNDGALPMTGSKKVTAFNLPSAMQTVLNSNGFTVNPNSTSAVLAANADYSATQLNSFKSYNDAAIIYFARSGGESNDGAFGNDDRSSAPTVASGSGWDVEKQAIDAATGTTGYNSYGPMLIDGDGNETWPDGTPYGWNHDALPEAGIPDANGKARADVFVTAADMYKERILDPVRHDQMLTLSEERMVQIVLKQGFKDVIVLLNTSHVMEMGLLNDHPKIGAILSVHRQISGGGTQGQTAVAKILNGTVNPSGRTIDEWPRDLTLDPVWQNFAFNAQTNSSDMYRYSDGTPTGAYAGGTSGAVGIYGVDYEESIYLGYKYWETYWAETAAGNTATSVDAGVWSQANQDAADEWHKYNVVWPLGYGLSYADFKYEVKGVFTDKALYNNIAGRTIDGSIFASGVGSPAKVETLYIPVTVQNLRGMTGKEVVQVYVTAPYTAGETEKSYVRLCGYTKTPLIENGQRKTVIVEVQVQDFASFDYNDANNNLNKGWELDAGKYTVHVMSTSHVDPGNSNYAAMEFTIGGAAAINLKLDDFSGNLNEPLFSDPDSEFYTIRDNKGAHQVNADPSNKMTLLSRADMDGTFPKAPNYGDLLASDYFMDEIMRQYVGYQAGGTRERSELGLSKIDDPDNPGTLIEQGPAYDYKDDPSDPWYKTKAQLDVLTEGWTQRNSTGSTDALSSNKADWLDNMAGIPLYKTDAQGNGVVNAVTGMTEINPQWTAYMNRLSYDELRYLASSGSYQTGVLSFIGKRVGRDPDGPNSSHGKSWGDQNTETASYNVELAKEKGAIIAELAKFAGTYGTGWYAPGVNIHRSPFSGRNAEYYGQDGFQAGLIAAAVVRGAEENGLNCYVKHIFLNDQETHRNCYSTSVWCDEQALRENYGVTAQKAMQEGGASSGMASFSRVGSSLAPANYNFMTGLFREQWGWTGIVVTDMFAGHNTASYAVPASPARRFDARLVDSFTPNPSSGAYTLSHTVDEGLPTEQTYTLKVDAPLYFNTTKPILKGEGAAAAPDFIFDEQTNTFKPVLVTSVIFDRTKNWGNTNGTSNNVTSLNEITGSLGMNSSPVDLMVRTGCDMPLGNQALTAAASASGRWSATMNGGKGGVFLKADGGLTTDAEMTVSAYHQYYYVRQTAMRILYQHVNSQGQRNGYYASSGNSDSTSIADWTNTASTRFEITGLQQGVAMTGASLAIPVEKLTSLKGEVSAVTYSITAGTLPAGLSFNGSTGAITGTPTGITAGNTDLAVTALIDGGYLTSVRYFRIAPIASAWDAAPAAAGTAGTAYSSTAAPKQAVYDGGSGTRAFTIASGALPAGVTIAATTGEITGTPIVPGAYNFTVQYQRGTGAAIVSQQFTITVGGIVSAPGGSIVSMTVTDGALVVTYENGYVQTLNSIGLSNAQVQILIDASIAGFLKEADVIEIVNKAIAGKLNEAQVQELIDDALNEHKADTKHGGCGSSTAAITALLSLMACAFVVIIKKQF